VPFCQSPVTYLLPQHLQQQQQQLQQQPQQQQKQKRRQQGSGVLQGPAEAPNAPWLGAKLDVGGYTKRGFISGGGKDQNQDRSVAALYATT
jgi:hypothetical protein